MFRALKTKLSTTKLPAMQAFYMRVFDMVVAEEWHSPDDRGVILKRRDGAEEALIELYHTNAPHDFAGLSLQFKVDDLAAFIEQLPGDIPAEGPKSRPWGARYLYLRDPEGIQLIVYEGGFKNNPRIRRTPLVRSARTDLSGLKQGLCSVGVSVFRRRAKSRAGFGVIALAALGLSACATEEALLLKEDPAYASGFGDGCVTAQEEEKSFSTKRVRDEYEFENNRAYRAGWRQGYLECRNPVRENDTGGRILGNEPGF